MRAKVLSICASVLAASVVTGSAAFGQSLLATHGDIIAPTGAAAPGVILGELFGNSMDNSVIDDAHQILFRANMTDSLGGTLSATTARALFLADANGNVSILARSGDPEPTGTIPGATLQTNTGNGPGGSYRIASNGLMLWGSSLSDGGNFITAANDTAYFVGTPGGWAVLAREGDTIPGPSGCTFSGTFSNPSQQSTAINAAGNILFKSTLAGGDVSGTANNEAWFTGTFASYGIMVRKGDFWGPLGEVVGALGFVSQMNASGQVAYDVNYALGSGGIPVTSADNMALFLYTPGVGHQEIWREGAASPIAGANYTGSVNTGSSTFNASGHVLLRCDLAGAVTAGVDDAAIIDVSSTGHSVVVRRGDPAPGMPGVTMQVVNNSSLQLADSGWIAFQSTISDGGVAITTANDETIWAGMPGSLTLVAREGDVAPGTGGGTFGGTMGQFMINNGNGQLLFNNSLVGGSNPGSSLWSWSPLLGLQAVSLSGETMEIAPGVFATTSSSGGIQFNNCDSRALSFAKDGTATWRQSFFEIGPPSLSRAAIVKVRIAPLTGTPGTISESLGGLQSLRLNAGPAHAGQIYVVIGGASGTMPGANFGPFHVPLNLDAYTTFTLANVNVGPFVNTFGILDSNGRGTAGIQLPGGLVGVAGLVVHHTFGVVDGSNNLLFVSDEAARLEIVP